jgi:predicted Zn-dependent protease
LGNWARSLRLAARLRGKETTIDWKLQIAPLQLELGHAQAFEDTLDTLKRRRPAVTVSSKPGMESWERLVESSKQIEDVEGRHWILMAAAGLLLERGQVKEALQVVREAEALPDQFRSGEEEWSRFRRIVEFAKVAQLYLKMGRVDDACEWWSLERDPKFSEPPDSP